MQLKIANKTISQSSPCFIIAEACDNHLGNMEWAKKLILHARGIGADAIKFQHHIPDEEMLPNLPMSDNFDEPLYKFLKKYALNINQHKELKDYCKKLGIIYLCTPFCCKAATDLNKIGVPAFKIGSGEMMDFALLDHIAQFGKPMLISTGMCTLDEITETTSFLDSRNATYALLNCTSEYPPKYDNINIGIIPILKNKFEKIIGHSDHTPDIYTSLAAVALGAKIIEKHITLDKTIKCPDQNVSISLFQFKELVEGIRKIEAAMGTTKKINNNEKQIRSWAYHSIVANCKIKKGEPFTKNNISTKRSGPGLAAKKYFKIIGNHAIKDFDKDEMIKI